mgnify:FL=1
MEQPTVKFALHTEVQEAYRDNFSRHLLGIARYLQSETMNALQQRYAHKHLRLAFAPYITLLGQQGKRSTELADLLGISRQACNQAVNQIEAAGYLERAADPRDRRAKLLVLTSLGMQLRKDGTRVVTSLDEQLTHIAGQSAIDDTRETLLKIHRGLQPGATEHAAVSIPGTPLGALLPLLGDHVVQRLMALTREKGHPGLKLSFGQVLTLIGPAGGKIQQIARLQDVSKQAISVIASELEQRGYLYRQADPMDARQVVLQFTGRGHDLIADSVSSVDELEAEFAALAGSAAVARMCGTLRALYGALQLEREIFEQTSPTDIRLLAQQLWRQLGAKDSRALAQLLLSPASNER